MSPISCKKYNVPYFCYFLSLISNVPLFPRLDRFLRRIDGAVRKIVHSR